MSQVIEDKELDRVEHEPELHPVAGSIAAVVWGLLLEGRQSNEDRSNPLM